MTAVTVFPESEWSKKWSEATLQPFFLETAAQAAEAFPVYAAVRQTRPFHRTDSFRASEGASQWANGA
jgi:hypothetical protein